MHTKIALVTILVLAFFSFAVVADEPKDALLLQTLKELRPKGNGVYTKANCNTFVKKVFKENSTAINKSEEWITKNQYTGTVGGGVYGVTEERIKEFWTKYAEDLKPEYVKQT